jgi:Holliday junction resolvase RusA-like endonuclease
MISFFISCIPRGQARPRHATIAGHHRAYKSKTQELDEATLQALMMPYVPDEPLDCPLSLVVEAFMPIPKSFSKRNKESARNGFLWPYTKPDASNILKHIEDVMQYMRFFLDDKQLCNVAVWKKYGERPGYQIELMRL